MKSVMAISGNYIIFITFLAFISNITAYRILGLFTHIGKSHFVMEEILMKGLAARGHQVVVVSHFPQQHPVSNYTDISLVGSMKTAVEDTPLEENVGKADVMFSFRMLESLAVDTCEKVLSFPEMQNLIKSQEKFDMIIAELFNTDCMLGFVHKFKVPFISTATSVMMPWANARFGNPDNPSYIPHHFLPHSDRMSFAERLLNTIYQESINVAYYIFMDKPTEKIARKYFGESLPPLTDIARNTSLLLLNTHFSLNQPRPLVPNIVEVGGLHISSPKQLPENIKAFLDGAEHGAVYFSLGSLVKSNTMPVNLRDAFLQAFSELPQRVLWKWEGEKLRGQSANVKTVSWLPQVDVLRHPNVRVFLTHGGLMGTIEAIHSGVPMVGIPLFGDQEVNIASYVSEGFALKLLYTNITKGSVLEALKTVLNVPSYHENAVRISRAYNDRPMSPLDAAIYWTEYVIRHGGAPHMRSAALDLYWYQYILLDVIGLILMILLIVLLFLIYTTKLIINLICTKKMQQKRKRQ